MPEEDLKELIVMDGQKRKIPINCSFMNCGYENDCILEAFKHFEREHTLRRMPLQVFSLITKNFIILICLQFNKLD